ncbi:MAG: hydroxylamine reductase, partial [Deltaproteobacteria bacterium]|nr:hydroxylamine reductase [Deltaproteobacteria bacterium]
ITPVKDAYKDRIYTTGMAGWPGVTHIGERAEGGSKDFSAIIEQAKSCAAPVEIETGTIVGGFAHAQVMALADKVVDAVKSGAIKRFVCAKYRYNKLNLGDIGGIPRVLDAGQCNDSYSLAYIALQLKEVFGLEDINDLPISYDIAWYEQKAVIVLLALLHLGVKGIRLGPTLPAFLSPNVAKVLIDNFDIKATGEVQADVDAMMAGN